MPRKIRDAKIQNGRYDRQTRLDSKGFTKQFDGKNFIEGLEIDELDNEGS